MTVTELHSDCISSGVKLIPMPVKVFVRSLTLTSWSMILCIASRLSISTAKERFVSTFSCTFISPTEKAMLFLLKQHFKCYIQQTQMRAGLNCPYFIFLFPQFRTVALPLQQTKSTTKRKSYPVARLQLLK